MARACGGGVSTRTDSLKSEPQRAAGRKGRRNGTRMATTNRSIKRTADVGVSRRLGNALAHPALFCAKAHSGCFRKPSSFFFQRFCDALLSFRPFSFRSDRLRCAFRISHALFSLLSPPTNSVALSAFRSLSPSFPSSYLSRSLSFFCACSVAVTPSPPLPPFFACPLPFFPLPPSFRLCILPFYL